ncbi:translocation/assembly module TamB domain-containing protein [Altererythrobacter lauratis]|uniref:Translocation/assembly module TamB domain-containing protein n=1 Tax=Alteraurantiacibacter lauratis TaxID=2054627 RepID=A0ABV7EC44_9SPHN
MAEVEAASATPALARRGMPGGRALVWAGRVLAVLAALLLAAVAFLHTPPGRQFLLNQIAAYAPASGLSVEAGGISGSVLWSASFTDVKFRDADGVLFLEVPEVDLNWRPWKWFFTGLDIRHLILIDGQLNAVPHLLPGDPDAPILPDFDIRVDRLVVEDLRVAEAVLGQERMVQFRARADVRRGRVFVDAGGELGGGDVLRLLAHAEPDGDIFDLELDWAAPQGGFLATMAGANEALDVRLRGEGRWTRWNGTLQAQLGGEDLIDLSLFNEAGQYRVVGRAMPGDLVEGFTARALGPEVAFTAAGTLEASVAEGSFALRGAALDVDGSGAVDLADNRFRGLEVDARLLDPTLFGEAVALEGAVLNARLDGPFATAAADHRLTVRRIVAGEIVVSDVVQQGRLSRNGDAWLVPLDATIGRVVSGAELFDPRLVNGRMRGALVLDGNRLVGERLDVAFPGLTGQLALAADLASGAVRVTGPVRATRLAFSDIGTVDSNARIDFAIGGGRPWSLAAQLDGRVAEATNATLETLAGQDIRFAGGLTLGEGQPLSFATMRITATKLEAVLDGRVEEGGTRLVGSGRHVDYGPFTVEATLADDGPRAELVLADPLPAAGLRDVRVSLEPQGDGFAILTRGESLLGLFDGDLFLLAAEAQPVRITVNRLDVAETRLRGQLQLAEGGVDGGLLLSGGGVEGRIGLAARPEGQGFVIDATARNARFGGEAALQIAEGDIALRGFVPAAGGSEGVTIEGDLAAVGVSYGQLFVGRLAGNAALRNGVGAFDAAIAGQRGSRFEMQLNGTATGDEISLALRGSHAGRSIAMPRRAVISRTGDGGWELQQAQISYGRGFVIANGRFGGEEPVQGRLALARMPLAVADVVLGDLGLGGSVSGVVNLAADASGVPVGDARLLVRNLSRSGLLLTSRPLDLALVADLSPSLFQARAVIRDGDSASGRLDARIADLPLAGAGGDRGLAARLYAGDLLAQLRYQGPAEALWRLAAIEVLDVAGRVNVAAEVRGTLGTPRVRGSVSGNGLQVQGAATGTDISNVAVQGRFDGSRLRLTRFSGTSPGGGSVVGSGFVDFSNMTRDRGPQLDVRLAARNARLLQLPGMRATVTGPMRFVSDGVNGTIAGRLEVREAFWRLGAAAETVELPDIAITEINLPPDIAPARRAARPWRYLVDARAVRGLEVDGMGLDSEWGGEIRLRGTTADPRIGGEVRIVPRQGYYTFAGVRFEITRGRIDFDESEPPNPRLDILAESEVDGISVDVTVRGNASRPEIAFSSVPSLPEEELMARLLFGGSITNLSATDALQLGAALAALRGGEGLDPINRLRTAIGLDRLRIVSADAAQNRGTAVALGKNITRRLYVELITDGQGYNATELEYRITRWISLLAAINTLGRGSVAAEYSRDY